MSFRNRVRLAIKINRPQFLDEKEAYRLADGTIKTSSVIVRKVFEGTTDWFPEPWHERLKIAFAHDTVVIEGEKYMGEISQTGSYDITWQEFGDYPTAPAKFKAEVTPYAATNSNCMTCDEATQLQLVDDFITPAVNQGTTKVVDVIANDNICCYPVVFTITYFNTDYVVSAIIDSLGIVTMVMKTPLLTANNAKLVTYRATCASGGYDEADVRANITGTIVGCLAPLNLAVINITTDGALITWDAPSPAPGLGYFYSVFNASIPGPAIQTGAVGGSPLLLSGLPINSDIQFFIGSDCGGTGTSNEVEIDFHTSIAESASCGRYQCLFVDPVQPSSATGQLRYMDCFHSIVAVNVTNGHAVFVCALETSPGNPVSITILSAAGTNFINYVGPC